MNFGTDGAHGIGELSRTASRACNILLAFCLCLLALSASGDSVISIVPRPVQIQPLDGTFPLANDTTVTAALPQANLAVSLLRRSTKLPLREDANPNIRFELRSLSPESYQLRVTPKDISIVAGDAAGFFYAAQTLLQLRSDDTTIRCAEITDSPRFRWRGLMLDVSRHFFNKDEVKRFLDLMAMHKLNVFHWHLVDDQGWRIEIKKYPRLTQIGAWRDGIGFGLDPKDSTAYNADGKYGGFFTQDDVREIIAYAKDRCITIVPEIEMPGHATAALDAFPQFSCTGEKHDVNIQAGVHHGVFCAGNDATFDFLQDVLSEVIDLFPGQYIHVGGDEVPKDNWKNCPKCQARIHNEHLKDEAELQSYFTQRIERFVRSKGKTLIGWDEILEGGLAEGATVMSWRGAAGGIAAANAGHDVVMSPTTHVYLDYLQERIGEPRGIGGFLPLQRVYGFEPIPSDIAEDQKHHILGAQGNLWSEYFPNFRQVEYMAYPRACALAEVAWSPAEGKSYDDFLRRMEVHMTRLEAMHVNARPLPPAGLDDSIVLERTTPPTLKILPRFEGGEIRYTLDGSIPTENSPRYESPIPVTQAITPLRVRFIRPPAGPSYLTEALILQHGEVLCESYAGTSDEKNPPGKAFDGDESTAYLLSGATPKNASAMEVRYLNPTPVKHIRVTTGSTQAQGEIIRNAVLEVSNGQDNWKEVATFRDGTAEANLTGDAISAIRVRLTQDQFTARTWIREFKIE